jgi:hypothetical protein
MLHAKAAVHDMTTQADPLEIPTFHSPFSNYYSAAESVLTVRGRDTIGRFSANALRELREIAIPRSGERGKQCGGCETPAATQGLFLVTSQGSSFFLQKRTASLYFCLGHAPCAPRLIAISCCTKSTRQETKKPQPPSALRAAGGSGNRLSRILRLSQEQRNPLIGGSHPREEQGVVRKVRRFGMLAKESATWPKCGA